MIDPFFYVYIKLNKSNIMLNEYKRKTDYEVGQLKNYIFLVPSTSNINYVIDNGVAIANEVIGDVIKIYCASVSMTSEETEETRFKFKNTVNVKFHESSIDGLTELLNDFIHNDYKVIVEDKMGVQYVCHLDFNAMVTYTYNFMTNFVSPNYCDVKFETDSNFPTLQLLNKINNYTLKKINPCEYNNGQILDFKLCDYNYTYIVRDNNRFSGVYATGSYDDSPYKDIEYIKNSLIFTEMYDGKEFTDTLQFSIPLSSYRSYWQYDLIEFKNNRYVALFNTVNGNSIASGYDNGYFPSYTISTSDNDASQNMITIILTHKGNQPFAYHNTKSLDDLINKDVTILYTQVAPFYANNQNYQTSVCLSNNLGAHTLLQETTSTGVKLNNYWVLQNYENTFDGANLNIVGHYNIESQMKGTEILFTDLSCGGDGNVCKFKQTPPKTINLTFDNKTFSTCFESECAFVLNSVPSWITIKNPNGEGSLVNGEANKAYCTTIEVVDNLQTPQSATIIMSNQYNIYPFTVNYLPYGSSSCDWIENVDNITLYTAQRQTAHYKISQHYQGMINPVTDVRVNSLYWVKDGETTQNIDGTVYVNADGSIEVIMTENETGFARQWVMEIEITTGDNPKVCNIMFSQDKKYYKEQLETGYLCDGKDEYQKLAVYYGYTPSQINIFKEYKKGDIIMTNSPNCQSEMSEWRASEDSFICENNAKYVKLELWISENGGLTWTNTGQTKKGTLLENQSPDCSTSYRWRDMGGYICDEGNKYVKLEKWSWDTSSLTWGKFLGETMIGDLIEVGAAECMALINSDFTLCYALRDSCNVAKMELVGRGKYIIDWGDGVTETHGIDDELNKKITVEHTYDSTHYNSCVNIKGHVIYCNVIANGNQVISSFDMSNAVGLVELRLFEDKVILDEQFPNLHKVTATTWDLKNAINLSYFGMDNFFYTGTLNNVQYTMPESIRDITFTNSNSQSSTFQTATQYANFWRKKEYKTPVVIHSCPLVNSLNEQITCSLSQDEYNAFEHNNIFIDNCCSTQGDRQFRWKEEHDIIVNSFICEGTNKYQTVYLQWRTYQSGHWTEWESYYQPIRYERGKLIETNSIDCGGKPTKQYKWEQSGEITCEGYASYRLEVQFESEDGGLTWKLTGKRRLGEKIQDFDERCGWSGVEPQYRWYEENDKYLCVSDERGELIKGTYDKSLIVDGVVPKLQYRKNGGNLTDVEQVNDDGTFTILSDGLYSLRLMFSGCDWLTEVTEINIEEQISTLQMDGMFQYCTKMKQFNPIITTKQKPTSMTGMFSGCTAMSSCNMSNFVDTSNIKDFTGIWRNCSAMTSLDISRWKCSYQYPYDGVLQNCSKLKRIKATGCNDTSLSTIGQWMLAYTPDAVITK